MLKCSSKVAPKMYRFAQSCGRTPLDIQYHSVRFYSYCDQKITFIKLWHRLRDLLKQVFSWQRVTNFNGASYFMQCRFQWFIMLVLNKKKSCVTNDHQRMDPFIVFFQFCRYQCERFSHYVHRVLVDTTLYQTQHNTTLPKAIS